MDKHQVEERIKEYHDRLGGSIFAFPIEEENPYSKYSIGVYDGITIKVFPEPMTIEEVASAVLETLKGFESIGLDSDYDRNVRFISYQAQVNAPSVTMHKLRKEPGTFRINVPVFKENEDVFQKEEGEEGVYLSARGILKFSYIEMLDKNPKAIKFMDEYYKYLSSKRYGKTPAAIKQEVRRMDKSSGVTWIEQTYKRYVTDSMVILDIMKSTAK